MPRCTQPIKVRRIDASRTIWAAEPFEHGASLSVVAAVRFLAGVDARQRTMQNLNVFKNEWAGTWLLIGLVGSVLLRGALWVLTVLNIAPLLGPVNLLLISAVGHTVGTAIWLGDIVASFLFAVATGVACQGLRGDRAWAYRLGQGLARFYVVMNAATAMVCGVVMLHWGPQSWRLLAFPFVLYIVSIVVAITAARQLAARRSLLQEPGQPEPAGQE